jgi:hypothetical protein
MFSSFFTKSKQAQAEKAHFVFPKYPCYAAVSEKNREINIDEYFSGSMDAKLAPVKLFATVDEAIAYLYGRPCAGARSYLLCLDQGIEDSKHIKDNDSGFGQHIVKAVKFSDYVMTRWDHNPLPPEKVMVLDNPHYKPKKLGESPTFAG